MAEITAAMVRDLREKTGAGMMDCKKALTESSGDVEAAVDWLRKKGLSAAAKKSGRVAAEGLVGVATADRAAAMVEVNAETDFVARNDRFQDFVAAGREARALHRRRCGSAPRRALSRRRPQRGRGADPPDRHHRREHEHPPRPPPPGAAGRGRHLRPQRRPSGSRQDRRAGRGGRRERARRAGVARPPGRHACRRRPAGGARHLRRRPGGAGAREGRAARAGRRQRQAGEHHREDGRGPDPQVLRGGGAAGAGLGPRRREPGEGGGAEGRRQARRLRPVPARRGHREAARPGLRVRGRRRGGRADGALPGRPATEAPPPGG